jgi:hypothetical protein
MRLLSALLGLLLVTGPAPARHVLYDGGSFYPRVIRLADGRLLASVTTVLDGNGIGVIEASDDGGATFHELAHIQDPTAASGRDIGYATLFELPSQVGAFPAGTVLWAATTGWGAPSASRTSRQRLWASIDDGTHWRFVSDIAASPNQYNTWEPSLSVAADGRLVAFYSDETDKPRHDQKLVQVRSSDAIHWTDYRETVVDDTFVVRPGMANVIRLPDGSWFMTYEVCNNDFVHLCGVYYRRSADGWDYGDPHEEGTEVRTADGKYLLHTPYPAWTPAGGPAGTILLIGEMVVNADGSLAADNGHAILTNTDLGSGPWSEIPSPVAVAGVNTTSCKNFSPSLLPSADGSAVLELATDLDGSVCRTYYASEPLG